MTICGANLGCGRLIFPVTKGDPMAEHISYALDALCPEAYSPDVEWYNFDKIVGDSQLARVRVGATLGRLDLFRYPWPIPDNQFDILWMSHIVEHIPHEAKLASVGQMNGKSMAEQMIFDEFDGWFVFFAECWRILKPGGSMHILAPYGNSIAGFTDPTHTRFVMPSSFGYFAIDETAPFDYALPYSFRQINARREAQDDNNALYKFVSESSDIVAKIDSLKADIAELPKTDRGQELAKTIDAQVRALGDYLQKYTLRHFNQISEMVYSFTPVK